MKFWLILPWNSNFGSIIDHSRSLFNYTCKMWFINQTNVVNRYKYFNSISYIFDKITISSHTFLLWPIQTQINSLCISMDLGVIGEDREQGNTAMSRLQEGQ